MPFGVVGWLVPDPPWQVENFGGTGWQNVSYRKISHLRKRSQSTDCIMTDAVSYESVLCVQKYARTAAYDANTEMATDRRYPAE